MSVARSDVRVTRGALTEYQYLYESSFRRQLREARFKLATRTDARARRDVDVRPSAGRPALKGGVMVYRSPESSSALPSPGPRAWGRRRPLARDMIAPRFPPPARPPRPRALLPRHHPPRPARARTLPEPRPSSASTPASARVPADPATPGTPVTPTPKRKKKAAATPRRRAAAAYAAVSAAVAADAAAAARDLRAKLDAAARDRAVADELAEQVRARRRHSSSNVKRGPNVRRARRERTRALETLEHQRVALEAAEERADALERQLEEARAVIDELRGRLARERRAGARDTGGAGDTAEAERQARNNAGGRRRRRAWVARSTTVGRRSCDTAA